MPEKQGMLTKAFTDTGRIGKTLLQKSWMAFFTMKKSFIG